MSEMRLPVCPICKREILLPLSTWRVSAGSAWGNEKIFGNWICTNCGFYITTGENAGTNPEDINADFNMPLRTRIEYLREEYKK